MSDLREQIAAAMHPFGGQFDRQGLAEAIARLPLIREAEAMREALQRIEVAYSVAPNEVAFKVARAVLAKVEEVDR